ncbi:MAG: hypothetical protein WEC33_02910 [Dehalococcoidia bacterium]
MAHGLGDGDGALAMLGEFGPVLRDGGVVVDDAAVGKDVEGGGGDTFSGGEAGEQRVGLHRARVPGAEGAGPGIHDESAALVRGDLDADLTALGDLTLDEVGDAGVNRGFGGSHGGLRSLAAGERLPAPNAVRLWGGPFIRHKPDRPKMRRL